ncbi:hypothetical protein ACFLR1_04880, partial [Bacteroidota bacterium]
MHPIKPIKHLLALLFVGFLALSNFGNKAYAGAVIGGSVYWECITSGVDAGKFVFYLKIDKDCTVGTLSFPKTLTLRTNTTKTAPLTFVSRTDVTPPQCGTTCANAGPTDVAVEQYLFKTDPVVISGTPPAEGYKIFADVCCRNEVSNLVYKSSDKFHFAATMYPYNGRDLNPCYDSSPEFAEAPITSLCSNYELRYTNHAEDPDSDSLSYEFAPAFKTGGIQAVDYAAGYSTDVPLPGPTIDPNYKLVTIDPVNGQIVYDGPGNLDGKWNITTIVKSWRCGKVIASAVREMTATIKPCTEPNNLPVISAPTWASP